MILAAAIPGNLIFLIIFAAVGVVNWWLERQKKKTGSDDARPAPRAQQPRAGSSAPVGESEQERLRRFLEALGVPQQPAQPPPRPRSIARPAEPARRPQISQPPRTAAAPPSPAIFTSRPSRKPTPFPEPEPMRSAGRLEEPAGAVNEISSEFQHMTMEQLGVPAHLAGTPAPAATLVRNAAAPVVESLRLALRTPADLRTAFVTMELLGKPKALQS